MSNLSTRPWASDHCAVTRTTSVAACSAFALSCSASAFHDAARAARPSWSSRGVLGVMLASAIWIES